MAKKIGPKAGGPIHTPPIYAICDVCGQRLRGTLDMPLASDDPEVLDEVIKFVEEHKKCNPVQV